MNSDQLHQGLDLGELNLSDVQVINLSSESALGVKLKLELEGVDCDGRYLLY